MGWNIFAPTAMRFDSYPGYYKVNVKAESEIAALMLEVWEMKQMISELS